MHEVVTLEGWSSPFVEALTRTRFGSGGSMRMQPDGCWGVAIFRNTDATTVLRSGLSASTVTHDHAAGEAVLAITLEVSGFRPQA